jgi:hypothetical protein
MTITTPTIRIPFIPTMTITTPTIRIPITPTIDRIDTATIRDRSSPASVTGDSDRGKRDGWFRIWETGLEIFSLSLYLKKEDL